MVEGHQSLRCTIDTTVFNLDQNYGYSLLKFCTTLIISTLYIGMTYDPPYEAFLRIE